MGLFSGVTDFLGITNWKDQKDALKKADSYFKNIKLPEERQLELERLVSVGELSPENAKDILMGSSAFSDIKVDPRLKQAQMDALTGLQEQAQSGLTASDRYELAKVKSEEDAQQRGSREAILQQEAMKGRSGGGQELLSQLQNQQASATRQSMRDQAIAAQSQQAKMAALQGVGQMGTQMRGQEFDEQAKQAQAKDLIDQFNVQNQLKVQQGNVDTRNRAAESNLANRQRIAEGNVNLGNQEREYNTGAGQRTFQNQMAMAQARAGQQAAQANLMGQQSSSTMNMLGQGAVAAATASDIRVKKNIEEAPMDIDNFLNEITGYKFNYKDPERHGEGRRLGVMAQDLEKSEMGDDVVIDGPTKAIDNEKALHALLAGTARLNERLNKIEGK